VPRYFTIRIRCVDSCSRGPGPKGYEYVALLRDRARLCLERKNLECAAQGYHAAHDFIRRFERGNDSVFTINIREWLALTNGLRGNYAEAEREFQAVRAQMTAIGGWTAQSYLAGLNELRAQVYLAAGKFEVAEGGFRDKDHVCLFTNGWGALRRPPARPGHTISGSSSRNSWFWTCSSSIVRHGFKSACRSRRAEKRDQIACEQPALGKTSQWIIPKPASHNLI